MASPADQPRPCQPVIWYRPDAAATVYSRSTARYSPSPVTSAVQARSWKPDADIAISSEKASATSSTTYASVTAPGTTPPIRPSCGPTRADDAAPAASSPTTASAASPYGAGRAERAHSSRCRQISPPTK